MRYQGFSMAVGLVCALASGTVLAESTRAAMSWNGHGQMFQIGVDEQEFLGVIAGVMYFESAGGHLDEAFVECTVKQRLHRGDEKTSAHGNCMIVQSSDDHAFAAYQCQGSIGACKGKLELTDGSGRFAGISGQSKLVLRSPLRQIAPAVGSLESIAVRNGILLLPALDYSIPGGGK